MNTIKKTLFIGKVFHHFSILDSTNTKARELLDAGPVEEGTVILADYQREGRGQKGNQWYSTSSENILTSIIFFPEFLPVRQQFLLNQVTSLAVRNAVLPYLPHTEVSVKWPNDVLIKERKVAGILIQNGITGDQIRYSIVGIGLNINQQEFKPDLPNATSLHLETGNLMKLDAVKESLFKSLEIRYEQLKSGEWASLRENYLQHLHRIGIWAPYQDQKGDVFQGRINHVDESGHLIMETHEGIRKFSIQEIKFL